MWGGAQQIVRANEAFVSFAFSCDSDCLERASDLCTLSLSLSRIRTFSLSLYLYLSNLSLSISLPPPPLSPLLLETYMCREIKVCMLVPFAVLSKLPPVVPPKDDQGIVC